MVPYIILRVMENIFEFSGILDWQTDHHQIENDCQNDDKQHETDTYFAFKAILGFLYIFIIFLYGHRYDFVGFFWFLYQFYHGFFAVYFKNQMDLKNYNHLDR